MKNKLSILVLSFIGVQAAACVDKEHLLELSSTTITPAGGVAHSADGLATVTFPPGAVPSDLEVLITVLRREPREGMKSAIYQLEPGGTLFQKDVELAITLDPTLTGRFFVANVDQAEALAVKDSSFDPATHIARGKLQHFSKYACFVQPGVWSLG